MSLVKHNRDLASRVAGPETERYVTLSEMDALEMERPRPSKRQRYKPHYGHYRPYGRERGNRGYRRSPGQALLIVALMMTVLVLFVGLGIDVGNLMGKRAKLQSAVDASALSAAQLMSDSTVPTSTIVLKADQILEANNVTSNTLAVRQVDVYTTTSQVHIHADQRVDTFFMRIVPAWKQVDVTADATADLNAYAEINIKPYGIPGVVNELNISVWGPDSWRSGGDAYSPTYDPPGAVVNPEHAKMPYGYLYRIDVPSDFPDSHLLVQIFDPDSYNSTTPIPTPWTPVPTVCPGLGTPCSTVVPSPTYYPNDGRFTWNASAQGERFDTFLNLNAFPITTTPIPTVFDNTRRAAFARVDEMRLPYTAAGIGPGAGTWSDSWMDTSTFTLWHFDPHITSAFADPSTLSDQAAGTCVATGGGSAPNNCVAYYRNTSLGSDQNTDLAWYQPSGYDITLNDPSCPGPSHDCYAREANGNFYFYIYVSTSSGSSENNFDFRVGPRNTNYTNNYTCHDLSNPPPSRANPCFANTQYMLQSLGLGQSDWDNGGNSPAVVFAKRAMPLNLDTGDHFYMLFTQVNKNAAGQTLAVRHFDQDCTGGCGPGHTMQYQLQLCLNPSPGVYTPCSPLTSDSCFGNPTTGSWLGYVSPNDGWYCAGCASPEKVQIPIQGTADYTRFFGPNGECGSSWFRLQSDPSYGQDTTVWELPFARPRLIK